MKGGAVTQAPAQCRVLVVDDSLDDRAEVRRLLLRGSERRYAFTEAETGAGAVHAVESAPGRAPDCVFLDYHLPDANALEVMAALVGPDGLLVCPVVVLTGSVRHEASKELLRAGAQDYLAKEGMTPESLTRALENAVERYTMSRELRTQAQKLKEREAHLRLALEASDTGLWTWGVKTGEVRWSPECFRIFGLPLGGFDGTRDAFFALVHPDDRDRVGRAVQAAVDAGTLYEATFRVLRADGAEAWVENRGRASYTDGGDPIEVLGTITDISERMRAEAELERARVALAHRERDLQRLADNSPDILTRFDRALRHLFVNAAVVRATGRRREEFIGRTNRELGMPGELCDLWERAMLAVFETGEKGSLAFSYLSADGERHYAASLVPELDAEGAVVSVLGVTHDVTDIKRAEASLKDADRRKDEFLATLAHELRNPLAPLRSGLQVLQRTQDPAVARRTREMMERQFTQMVRLIDDLLDVSRITSGKVVLRREQVSLRATVEAAVESVRPLLETAEHRLTVDLPEAPLWLDADPARLAQVLSNLLTNAAKYTPDGGHITLSARREGDEAVVAVSDTGIGIPPDMLDRVFGMFTQVNRSLDRAQGGLGIGLALVKRLVELHGGAIRAESGGPHRGSTFTLRLPARAVLTPSVRPPAARDSGPPRRVLVVDDNTDGAETMAVMLGLAGHEARSAFSGREALDVARSFHPDVVLLDIGMPEMDGYEVAQRFRADPDLREASLVALTGWGTEDDRRRALAAGFDFHLTKPIEAAVIEDVIARCKSADAVRA